MIDDNLIRRHERRVAKERDRRASLLNNTKYRELFQFFNSIGIVRGQVKTLTESRLYWTELAEYEYVPGYTADGCGGPIKFKEIEYVLVDIPHKVSPDVIETGLGALGQISWEWVGDQNNQIRIDAYNR